MRQFRGCCSEPQVQFEFEGQKLSRCPVRLVSRITWELIGLYQHYRKGFLLTDGGLLKQPYRYLQAMQVIEGEINRCLREKAGEVSGLK